MRPYHKIQSVFMRGVDHKVIEGAYSLPEFEYLKSNDWTYTEKLDGCSLRTMFGPDENTGLSLLRFGGKTDNAQIYIPLLNRLQELFTIEKMLEAFSWYTETPASICLYGEGIGAKVQKGGGNYIPDGVDFVLFDIMVGDTWLERHNVAQIAERLSIKVVPIIGTGTLFQATEMAKKGFNSKWGEFLAEGIVLRPQVELQTRRGHRIITKIKHKDF